jgi:predicted esterase
LFKHKAVEKREGYRKGHLTAKPGTTPSEGESKTGLQTLELSQMKDCLLYVPKRYQHQHPAAVALMLHGAGGNAEHGISYIRQYADEKNIILLAPASEDYSWDIIAGNAFGADVMFIDRALTYVFTHFSIVPSAVAIGGFSDGASYALSIGLSNGNLFSHIIAFSPGFYYTYENRGKPSVYLSHGTGDDVLPIDPCSRRIVPKLKLEGLAILYEEFNGRHEIPPSISKAAVDWFVTNEQ